MSATDVFIMADTFEIIPFINIGSIPIFLSKVALASNPIVLIKSESKSQYPLPYRSIFLIII